MRANLKTVEEFLAVDSTEKLWKFLIAHHNPKILLVNQGDFWRIWNSMPSSQRYLDCRDDDKVSIRCLRTTIEMVEVEPRPEVIDVS